MFAQCPKLQRVNFNGLKVIHAWDDGGKSFDWLPVEGMFSGCKSLTTVDLSNFDTTGFTDFRDMFANCESLREAKLGGVDTSDATEMDGMFQGCKSLTSLDVSGFDTGKAKSMSEMFDRCTSLQKLSVSDGFYKASTDLRKSAALPDVSTMTGYDAGAYSGKWVRTDGSVPALVSTDLTGNAVPEGSSYAGTWIWQNVRTLNYDANGGEGAPAAQPFWFGDRDAVSSEVPARASYDFLGWNTAADGSGVAVQPGEEIPYEAADGTALVDEKGLTLYAQWREQTYTITYDPAGGTWADGTTDTVAKTYGKASEPAKIFDAPTREGYKFVRWEGSSYQPGDVYDKRGKDGLLTDDTLTAVWEKVTAPSGDKPGVGMTVPTTGASDELPAKPGATAKVTPKVPETGDSDLGGIAAALAVLGTAALAGVTGIRFSSDRR